MSEIERVLSYLKENNLRLTTAESCTAGMAIEMLADIPGSGSLLDCGYVVYSVEAKRRLLGVRQQTIDSFGLTSEEVAIEMANGALRDSTANVAVANTGVAGPDPMGNIEPGVVCIAWGFQHGTDCILFSRTLRFHGDRTAVRRAAAVYGLIRIERFHARVLRGERG